MQEETSTIEISGKEINTKLYKRDDELWKGILDQKIELLFTYLNKFIDKEDSPREKIGFKVSKNLK